mmetsp:Transcript_6219/g.11294  ORF Transcript_6219/g.11294 Transcript_6219/m.11294 type:complete len:279 (+) Transcript_6219:1360-2196(+)
MQSSHSVSVVEELAVLMNFPAPHMEAARQPTAPSDEEYFPSAQSVHNVVPPTEYRPAGQSVNPVRSLFGLLPAGAVLQEDSPTSSEYSPSPLHVSQLLKPPVEALPTVQVSHSVSEVELLGVLMYIPAPQVDAAVQPTAPSDEEYFPSSHSMHSVDPPRLYLPAGQGVVDSLFSLGLVPAGELKQEPAPSSSVYSPSPSQSEHSVALKVAYFPSSHFVHTWSMAISPGSQALQPDAPASDRRPEGQSSQVSLPPVENFPFSQFTQVFEDESARFPAPQ